ncbi:MAG: hypothetical protein A2X86_09955 [Bdellovibrionales bacterium GWA2_49_15]|nr:MAG: hypothetical protein A2X86_09955 [Bdellovibrionales bacterium GWA2_49_15]HAZ13107.1 hypothetical protein [Bdellovibrionales bacterium]
MSEKFFISHSSQDAKWANQLVEILEGKGKTCWVAPRNIPPTQNYAQCILDALEGSTALILLYTKSAENSVQVQREVDRAINAKLTIAVLMLENITPTGPMEYYLCNTQWISAYGNNWDSGVANLLQALDGKASLPTERPKRKLKFVSLMLVSFVALALGAWYHIHSGQKNQTLHIEGAVQTDFIRAETLDDKDPLDKLSTGLTKMLEKDDGPWEYFPKSLKSHLLSFDELDDLDDEVLTSLRKEIFARHGTPPTQKYIEMFTGKSWYKQIAEPMPIYHWSIRFNYFAETALQNLFRIEGELANRLNSDLEETPTVILQGPRGVEQNAIMAWSFLSLLQNELMTEYKIKTLRASASPLDKIQDGLRGKLLIRIGVGHSDGGIIFGLPGEILTEERAQNLMSLLKKHGGIIGLKSRTEKLKPSEAKDGHGIPILQLEIGNLNDELERKSLEGQTFFEFFSGVFAKELSEILK